MHIEVRSPRDQFPPSVVEFAEDHLFAALMRFADKVSWARLRLIDLNGPTALDDARCLAVVQLKDGTEWIAVGASTSIHESIDVALRRVRRQISRHLVRPRTPGATQPPKAPLELLEDRLRELSLA